MADAVHVHEEQCAVQSRISWGAIMAGAVVSLAVYLIMSLLGAAIGLTVRDDMSAEGLGTGAGIWAVLTTVVALFVGGYVASQTVVGETKGEAVIHSIIMWGVVMAMIMWLVASGARAGFSAMVGFSQFADNMGRPAVMDDARQRMDDAANSARQNANNPQNREAALNRATEATWWALVGTLLSIAAAVGGGWIGGGTQYRWLSMTFHHRGTGTVAPGMGA